MKYTKSKISGQYIAQDNKGRVCGLVSKESMDNAVANESVKIKYWQQETIEFGRWVETEPMPRRVAESILCPQNFPRGEILEADEL